MKIAHVYPHAVIPQPPMRLFDAISIVNYEIARRLGKDHSVVVYAAHVEGQPREEIFENVTWKRVPVTLDRAMNTLKALDSLHILGADRPYRHTALYYAPYARRVARDVRARQCEIVHIHSIASFVPVFRKANRDARIVLHMHDHSLTDFDPVPTRARLADATLILGCSDHIINGIRARFPEVADRCRSLHNGVDARFLQFHTRPEYSDTVLFVGRLSPEKGVHVLLEAFGEVARQHPQAELRLVGPFDVAPRQFVDPLDRDRVVAPISRYYAKTNRYSQALHRWAQGLGARVTFVPPTPNINLGSQYAQAGIFVFPSVWHEPFGIPLVEAMAAGLPVITTKGGAAGEIVDDGVTGLLVKRGDVRELAQAIDALLRDPARRALMGAAGRERAARLFTWDQASARLSQIYEQLLGAQAAPPFDAGTHAARGHSRSTLAPRSP